MPINSNTIKKIIFKLHKFSTVVINQTLRGSMGIRLKKERDIIDEISFFVNLVPAPSER